MDNTVKAAMRDWNAEVSAETARLIALGVPPWDAAIQARQRVEKRRREKAAGLRGFIDLVAALRASAPRPEED